MRLLLATRNAHKLQELRRLLPGVELESLPDHIVLPPETGLTFAANAAPKARAAARALDRPAIADDSGIEAAALAGAPGVRSARFAGEAASDAENLARLRSQVPAGSELAYVCALAYAQPGGTDRIFQARCTGRMAAEARGRGGFGYDPVFVPDGVPDGRTMAELSASEKDAISHRGQVARALLAWLVPNRSSPSAG